MAIFTEADLGKALKGEQNTIEIEGDLKNKVLRIKATGAVAWGIAIGAIGIVVYGVMATPATGGGSAVFAGFTATGAVSILGASATYSAIAIAVAAGGVGSLNKLRKYKIVEKTANKLVLKRR